MLAQVAVQSFPRGDAAHVHPPMGGQGLNIGVQDAVNLGWKLAQVIKATSPQDLLDTYHAERHPVGARVLRNTMAQTTLRRTDDRTKALGDTLSELLGMDEPRRRIAGEMSGLDITTNLGQDTRYLDAACLTSTCSAANVPRVCSLCCTMRDRCYLTLVGRAASTSSMGRSVQLIEATYADAWELPVLGEVTAPTAVLVRPDGYVAGPEILPRRGS